MFRISKKTQEEIMREWDNIAEKREEQIESGKDLSFHYLLLPTIFKLSEYCDKTLTIDVGCGTGYLTNIFAKSTNKIIGVDVSNNSIKIAKTNYKDLENLEFICSSIEEYARNEQQQFSLAISNMALMTVLALDEVLHSIFKILKHKGHFIFTIIHPCYWPLYWGYYTESWFDYKSEIAIETEFKISLDKGCNQYRTTHIHRPLEKYINSLLNAGFIIDKVLEPMPDISMESKYPSKWKYPRFMGMRCIKP